MNEITYQGLRQDNDDIKRELSHMNVVVGALERRLDVQNLWRPLKTAGLVGLLMLSYCAGYGSKAVFGAGFESTYAPVTNTCDSKKKARKYAKAIEGWSEEQKEWFVLNADFEKEYPDLDGDGLVDMIEVHSARYLRGCDPDDWRFKDTYVRVHLSGGPDKVVSFKGGLPTGFLMDVGARTLTLKGMNYDLSLWEKEVEY